jgi:hypothetical protein
LNGLEYRYFMSGIRAILRDVEEWALTMEKLTESFNMRFNNTQHLGNEIRQLIVQNTAAGR